MYNHFIGIDAGKKGAIAVLNSDGELLGIIRLRMRSLWGREIFDPQQLVRDISSVCATQQCDIDWEGVFVLVEQVNPRKQGRSSAFSFSGNSIGIVIALETIGAKVQSIPSDQWKEKLKVGSSNLATQGSSEAEHSKFLKLLAAKKAKELFPKFKFKSSATKDEEESSLIAWLGWNSCKKVA
ncbi:MAG: hypothetical protein V7L23_15395 [Nostoc sp.]|uniref:hypothetical protein n=1 Tax=Nostoc sp. TaxID=1180 RepID=UPI002FF26994